MTTEICVGEAGSAPGGMGFSVEELKEFALLIRQQPWLTVEGRAMIVLHAEVRGEQLVATMREFFPEEEVLFVAEPLLC